LKGDVYVGSDEDGARGNVVDSRGGVRGQLNDGTDTHNRERDNR